MLIDPVLGGAVSFFLMFLYVYVKYVRESDIKYEDGDDNDDVVFPLFINNNNSDSLDVKRRRSSSSNNLNLPRPTATINGDINHVKKARPVQFYNYNLPGNQNPPAIPPPAIPPPPPPVVVTSTTKLSSNPTSTPIARRMSQPISPLGIKTRKDGDNNTRPAGIQISVAQKARIPLFLNTPLYNKQQQKIPQVSQSILQVPQRKEPPLPSSSTFKNNYHSLHIPFDSITLGPIIGSGAFGLVHRGIWRGTPVAIKLLNCQNLSAEILAEFESEVEIMSILRHPNICLLMGAVLTPPKRALVVELVAQGSLWDVLRNTNSSLPLLSIARDTAMGMTYLHGFTPTPILHRDLKSPNLLCDTSFKIKISDFGLSRMRAYVNTVTNNCAGTIQWMAPEVLAASGYTKASDVYSYGIILYELLTRRCPFEGLSSIQAALGVLNNNLRPAFNQEEITMKPDPAALGVLVVLMKECWDSDPSRRPSFSVINQRLSVAIMHRNNNIKN